jgi:lipopolysaccharide exporter
MTAMGLLQRELRFRELSMVTVAAYVLGSAAGVGSALLGAGVWSLVVASLTTNSALAILQYLLVRHPVRPVLRWEPYRTLGGYGSRLVGAHLLDYVGSNLDTFVVGRVASTSVLGEYSRAYSLIVLPLRFHLTQALTNVLFSQLSRIQDDAARLRRAYLSVLGIMGVILFPACAWIAVAAHELVLVVLGPQWDLTAAIVPWFALAGCSSVISALSQSFMEVRADLNRSLAMQCAYLLVLGALLTLALKFQSRGVWVFAAAVATGETIRHVGYLALVRRSLHLSAAQVARSYAPASFASAGVVLAVASIRWVLVGNVPLLVLFAIEVAVGGLALALFIRLYPSPSLRHELWLRGTSAGMLGGVGGLRWRLALLVLGRPEPSSKPESRP